MVAPGVVHALSSAADDVVRNLPDAHWITRWYRRPRFRDGVERFIRLLYQIDVPSLADSELEETERLTRVAISLLEAHMLLHCTSADVAECQCCAGARDRLRDALDALDAGLPTDPARRPTDEQLLNELAEKLQRAS